MGQARGLGGEGVLDSSFAQQQGKTHCVRANIIGHRQVISVRGESLTKQAKQARKASASAVANTIAADTTVETKAEQRACGERNEASNRAGRQLVRTWKSRSSLQQGGRWRFHTVKHKQDRVGTAADH